MNYTARVEEGKINVENLSPDVRFDSDVNTTIDAEKSTIAKS